MCIGLVVTIDGFPLGHEVFAGNRNDVKTLEEVVEAMEAKYGKAKRIWVFDRGIASEANLEFLRERGGQYLVGTPKSRLRKFEKELIDKDWREVRHGIEVKLVPAPGGEETFVLCRSRDRRAKEKAMPAGPNLRRSRPSGTTSSFRGSRKVSSRSRRDFGVRRRQGTKASSNVGSGVCSERTRGRRRHSRSSCLKIRVVPPD